LAPEFDALLDTWTVPMLTLGTAVGAAATTVDVGAPSGPIL
jgi:hypothetical protein